MTSWNARRLALDALLHRRGRFLASVLGVAFAGTLAIAQLGLYAGFLNTCSSIARHVPGDLWVMAHGTEVIDYGEPLGADVRHIAAAHPCVAQVSGLIVDFMPVRSGDDRLRTVQLIGVDEPQRRLVPWHYARGDGSALSGARRIAIDERDALKLAVPEDGDALEFAGGRGYVAATTRGIQSIALTPYVFTSLPDARMLAKLPAGSATFWVVQLSDANCAARAAADIAQQADVEVLSREGFIRRTEAFWIEETGIGAMLLFGTLLALLIGTVVVGQTLHGLVAGHRRELAMLKALGGLVGERGRLRRVAEPHHRGHGFGAGGDGRMRLTGHSKNSWIGSVARACGDGGGPGWYRCDELGRHGAVVPCHHPTGPRGGIPWLTRFEADVNRRRHPKGLPRWRAAATGTQRRLANHRGG